MENLGAWIDAGQLTPGDTLLAPDGGRVRILAIVAYGALAAVHNLTVADIHTYYELVGKPRCWCTTFGPGDLPRCAGHDSEKRPNLMTDDQSTHGPTGGRETLESILRRAIAVGPDALHEYCMAHQNGVIAIGSAFVLTVRAALGEHPNLEDTVGYSRTLAQSISNVGPPTSALAAEALVRATYGEVHLLRNIPAEQLVQVMSTCVYLTVREIAEGELVNWVSEVDDYVSLVGQKVAEIVAEEMDMR